MRIDNVVSNELCTGCATCISLCPNEAIELIVDKKNGIYIPRIQENVCINCGICIEVCPGYSVDFKKLNKYIFGKPTNNIYLGNYIDIYTGHSLNYDVRYNSASGGLITQILIFALDRGIISGALVTRMKKDSPLEPEPFIARTSDEIIEASKSKYCPVPANIMLREIIDSNDGERFAIVGLPCHMHGIRMAEIKNKNLGKKIVMHLGLFCHHTPNFLATEYLLNKLKLNKKNIIAIDYRGNGWPGKTRIQLQDHDQFLPFSWKFIGSYLFTPLRCFLCSDGINELSDISFGDAWMQEFSEDKIGKSVIISKTKNGDKLLHDMLNCKLIDLNRTDPDKFIKSFSRMLNFKKSNINARIHRFNKEIYYENILPSDILDNIIAIFPFLCVKLSSNNIFKKFLLILPIKVLWVFSLPYLLIYYIKSKLMGDNLND